ncbi:LuxR family two component transcriptional regulator [Actinocorallia herbida]|uniref:LuxR family two component transcriptional regulator n=1 Tax=Actinocorallia herbida TaxID=58109 RepID=A0A3N1D1Q1_9ACTN|nr:response regulator transcription factor [Actinocorallia herbida]ROO87441.1 LuxR family two component transcriptional regulator [Actinocorallia herbida]
MTDPTIRVLLADDQALLRTTFRMLLDAVPGIDVVGEAADGRTAVTQARTLRPDVIVMDIRMPGTDGLAATRAICADPDLAATRILILTTFETDEYVAQALYAGASGFLGKGVSADDLIAALRTVAAGDSLLSPTATRALIGQFLSRPQPPPTEPPADLADLTTRERQMMALAAQGLTNTEIADRLTLSPLTVRTHIHRAMTKLGARDRTQLVVIAYRTGLVRPSPDPPAS